MKTTCLMFLVAAIPAAAISADARVEFRDCPKCDKRIRIDLAAGKAYVNLSRLEGASRDEVAARAQPCFSTRLRLSPQAIRRSVR